MQAQPEMFSRWNPQVVCITSHAAAWFLSQVAVNVLTTGEYGNGVPIGPSAQPVKKHVVLIDLDSKWDIRRFIAVRTKWVLKAWPLRKMTLSAALGACDTHCCVGECVIGCLV